MNAGPLKCYVMSLYKNQKLPKWSQTRNKAILGSFKHSDLSWQYQMGTCFLMAEILT